jgi:hypothetical protein
MLQDVKKYDQIKVFFDRHFFWEAAVNDTIEASRCNRRAFAI